MVFETCPYFTIPYFVVISFGDCIIDDKIFLVRSNESGLFAPITNTTSAERLDLPRKNQKGCYPPIKTHVCRFT
jgi:hypothetical protein